MNFLLSYNENSYLYSWKGAVHMNLDVILQNLSKCTRYSLLDEVSNYLFYIDDDVFYVAPSFNEIKTDNKISTLNPRFILFSAPGATGKSCLAKYIAHKYNAIYWDTSKLKLGENTFDGSLLNMVGPAEYSRFTTDLCEGRAALVIDAFDEAEAISGRTAIQQFIKDLNRCIADAVSPCAFLFSRTETAQFIASLCAEKSIPFLHYEIGFFEETQSLQFMEGQLSRLKKANNPNVSVTAAERDCIKKYYDAIQQNISTNERASFLGYAPVLQAISSEIKETSNTASLISKLSGKSDCTDIIIQIMHTLLDREQEKVTEAFSNKCKHEHPEFSDWKNVYSAEEQLNRIVSYLLFRDTKYENYQKVSLPPQLIDDYQSILDAFLPQHPFIQNFMKDLSSQGEGLHFTGPAFRDYTLAKLILDPESYTTAQMYLDETGHDNSSPSPIFSDCYLNICQGKVYSSHISYVYESYRSKAHAFEKAYLQYIEQLDIEGNVSEGNVILGMIASKNAPKHPDLELNMIMDSPQNPELCFERMSNISLDAPNVVVRIGRSGVDTSIHNSQIVCKKIIWDTSHLLIEAKNPTGCSICTKDVSSGNSPRIEIVCAEKLNISMPDIAHYYKFLPFKYEFEDPNSIDILKFTHALRCILVEFRTHSKDTLAKHIERIDNVVVGSNPIKQKVLAFMKDTGIIYEESHLYKVNPAKMQECKISFIGLSNMNFGQLEEGYEKFKAWESSLH